jgi:long-chain-fatty-acid--CoA ligase ACSBG
MRDNREYVWSWNEYFRDCLAFAKSLSCIGIDERMAVNIMGHNSPEWAICFFGSIFHNNVVSGVYITNGPQACLYQAENSDAQVLVCDTPEQLNLYMSIVDKLPHVKAVITWGMDKIPEEFAKDSRVYTFKSFLEIGKKVKDELVNAKMDKQRPGQCAVLIYTSGTTGNPKGVMLSHDNIIFNGSVSVIETIENTPNDVQIATEDMRIVSYLPLSHIAGM